MLYAVDLDSWVGVGKRGAYRGFDCTTVHCR